MFAKLDGEITAFLAEKEDVTPGRVERKLGLRASHTGSVLLEEARLPADRVLGNEGQGLEVAFDFLGVAAPGRGERGREAFGRPILSRQGISFKLADMAMLVEAGRLLVGRAAAAVDAGLVGSYAKAFAADAAMQITTDAVQVLGGAGSMHDHPVEKWMRDAKVSRSSKGRRRSSGRSSRHI